jgi:heme/copper-type cytochrome/quinol oxidase subunit 2
MGAVFFMGLTTLLLYIPMSVWSIANAYEQIKEKNYNENLYLLYVMFVLSLALTMMSIYSIYMYIYTGSM